MSDNQTFLLLQEKIAALQGTLRKLQDEKLKLQSDVDLLNQEKQILLKALTEFTEMEQITSELKSKNILLESQLNSLMSSLERLEKDF